MKNMALTEKQVEQKLEDLNARRDKIADLRIDLEYKLDLEKDKFMQAQLIKFINELTTIEESIEEEIKYTERALENAKLERQEKRRELLGGIFL